MAENKTQPTAKSVPEFLSVSKTLPSTSWLTWSYIPIIWNDWVNSNMEKAVSISKT